MKEAVCVGKNLWSMRRAAGLSREMLAKESGVSAAAIKRIESMTHDVRLSTLSQIAVSLGVEVSAFFEDHTCENSNYYAEHTIQKDLRACIYPEEPRDYHVCTLRSFIAMLPLFDRERLADALLRIRGQFCSYEDYVLDQLEKLYMGIPDSPAKRYANFLSEQDTPQNEKRYEQWQSLVATGDLDVGYDQYGDALQVFAARIQKTP